MMTKIMRWLNAHYLSLGVALSVFAVALAGNVEGAFADGAATYDISPVTTSLTSELTANVPIILGVVGALIALSIAVRMVRKFVKA
jgi:cell division protein FtsX